MKIKIFKESKYTKTRNVIYLVALLVWITFRSIHGSPTVIITLGIALLVALSISFIAAAIRLSDPSSAIDADAEAIFSDTGFIINDSSTGESIFSINWADINTYTAHQRGSRLTLTHFIVTFYQKDLQKRKLFVMGLGFNWKNSKLIVMNESFLEYLTKAISEYNSNSINEEKIKVHCDAYTTDKAKKIIRFVSVLALLDFILKIILAKKFAIYMPKWYMFFQFVHI